MRFLLSGGGTAGHVYPASTVAGVLRESGHEVAFVGTSGGIEARLAAEAGIAFSALPSAGWDRSRPWTFATGVAVMAVSALRALGLLGRSRPDAVVGFGGYVSIPLGFACALRRVPLVLHEQNSVPGFTTRFLSRWARSVALTYPGSEAMLRHPERAVLTGNPVRPEILAASRAEGRAELGVPDDALMLLVFGGSRGARHVNTATVAMCERLMAVGGLHVVHVAGREEAESVREALAGLPSFDASRYHVIDYVERMGSAIAAADLVVARAGATSIAEITVIGRPAVLVPYPYATDDHQTRNAATVEAAGAAALVADADLDTTAYADAVLGLLGDPGRRETMRRAAEALGRPQAAEAVAALAREAASKRG